jgi:hypothetical protein
MESERVLGQKHPDTLTVMANLAVTFSKPGQMGEGGRDDSTSEKHKEEDAAGGQVW